MKKALLLFLLFSRCSESSVMLVASNPFVRNVLDANLHEVEIGFIDTFDADNNFIRRDDVFRVDPSAPLNYSVDGDRFRFVWNDFVYTFVRSEGSDKAIFSYTASPKSTPEPGIPLQYTDHVGFVLIEGGLYSTKRKVESPIDGSYAALMDYISPDNIDLTQRESDVPLLQTPGLPFPFYP